MANKVIKKAQPDQKNTTSAPSAEVKDASAPAPASTPSPKNVAELAKAAAQARAAETSSRAAPVKMNVTNEWTTKPQGCHPSKGVPAATVTLAQERAKKEGAAIYLVEVPNKRGHHAIIAVSGDNVATHGGCVQPGRAVYYGRLHGSIYGLGVNASLASEEVRKLLAAEEARPAPATVNSKTE